MNSLSGMLTPSMKEPRVFQSLGNEYFGCFGNDDMLLLFVRSFEDEFEHRCCNRDLVALFKVSSILVGVICRVSHDYY